MIWAFAAYFGNVIEQLLIASVVRDMNPMVFGAVFYTFSILFLGIYSLAVQKKQQFFDVNKALQHKLLVIGFAGGGFIGNALYFTSVFLMGVSMTVFLLVFIRVLVTVYAYVFMKDRFPIDKMIAFATGVAMLFVFSFGGGEASLLGVVVALLSCFGFALEDVMRKKLTENELRPENMMLFRNGLMLALFIGAVFVSWSLGNVELGAAFSLSLYAYAAIAGAALIGGTLGMMFAFYAMKTVKLSQFQALLTTKPVLVAVSAVMLLGEEISVIQWIAGVVIILSAAYFLKPDNKVK